MKNIPFNDGWLLGVPSAWRQSAPPVPVKLPHDAMISQLRSPDAPSGNAKGYWPEGSFLYSKDFSAPKDWASKAVSLNIEGAYRDAKVYINGALAAERPYGYSGFLVDLNPFLNYSGENRLEIVVSTGRDSRWYSGAGLYRPLHLLVGGACHFFPGKLQVETRDVETGTALLEVRALLRNLQNVYRAGKVHMRIIDQTGAIAAEADQIITLPPGETPLRQRLLVESPALWSPETPSLYHCEVKLILNGETEAADEEIVAFGIRTLSMDAKHGLRINGQEVKLRGACIHHDNGLLGAATFAAAEWRRVQKMKEAGFNALRSAHHPISRDLLEVCDALGILVMDEAFDMWTIAKNQDDYSSHFVQWWQRDVEAMVEKDFNHPSVVLYSLGNEIPEAGTGHGIRWGRLMSEELHRLDNTRFTINCLNALICSVNRPDFQSKMSEAASAGSDVNEAMNNLGDRMERMLKSDLIGNVIEESACCADVIGYNYMESRYEQDIKKHPQRVFCGSETYPAHIDVNWALVKKHPAIIGDFTWAGWDYLGEAGIGKITYRQPEGQGVYGEWPWRYAFCGDFDITGFRRPASYYREIVFGLRDAPYIAVQDPRHYGEIQYPTSWSWTDTSESWTWPGLEGKPVVIEIYCAAPEVELLVNGKSLGRKPAGEAQSFKALFETVYSPGELMAIAWQGNNEAGRMNLSTAGDATGLRLISEQEILSADGTGIAFIELALCDNADHVNTADNRKLYLTVEGPAVLAGMGSAKPDSEESFHTGFCSAWGGRAQAIVRATGVGSIQITAEAEGLSPKTLLLEAK